MRFITTPQTAPNSSARSEQAHGQIRLSPLSLAMAALFALPLSAQAQDQRGGCEGRHSSSNRSQHQQARSREGDRPPPRGNPA